MIKEVIIGGLLAVLAGCAHADIRTQSRYAQDSKTIYENKNTGKTKKDISKPDDELFKLLAAACSIDTKDSGAEENVIEDHISAIKKYVRLADDLEQYVQKHESETKEDVIKKINDTRAAIVNYLTGFEGITNLKTRLELDGKSIFEVEGQSRYDPAILLKKSAIKYLVAHNPQGAKRYIDSIKNELKQEEEKFQKRIKDIIIEVSGPATLSLEQILTLTQARKTSVTGIKINERGEAVISEMEKADIGSYKNDSPDK